MIAASGAVAYPPAGKELPHGIRLTLVAAPGSKQDEGQNGEGAGPHLPTQASMVRSATCCGGFKPLAFVG